MNKMDFDDFGLPPLEDILERVEESSNSDRNEKDIPDNRDAYSTNQLKKFKEIRKWLGEGSLDPKCILDELNDSISKYPNCPTKFYGRAYVKNLLRDYDGSREDEIWGRRIDIRFYNSSSESCREFIEWTDKVKAEFKGE